MLQIAIPSLSDIVTWAIIIFILLIALVIFIAVVKIVLHFFLAIVAGIIVWYLAQSLLLGAIAFLAVAIITTTRRKQTVIYAGQPAGKICPNCGLALSQNAQYCPRCGRRV